MHLPGITVNSRKYDQSIRRSWACELVSSERSLLVFRGVFESDVQHHDLGLIKQGTVSDEYYWLDQWFNIFRFQEPNGSLRNYYANIAMPPEFDGKVLNYVDMDIDVVVWPDLRCEVLDETEFEFNAERYDYPVSVRLAAKQSLNDLLAMIEQREFPFTDL